MKRIIIICEGQTEREFCQKILYPFFLEKDICIEAPLIKKSAGGIVHWETLCKQVQIHLIQDTNVVVTTLIDYYGIHEKHQFPAWQLAHAESDKTKRMAILENGMKQQIADVHRYRFLPYIQLHEFEGLLFNTLDIFDRLFSEEDFLNKQELIQTIANYPNPEEINNNPETAPSKRLERCIRGYKKVVYGTVLAESIGLERIRQKSPRFNQWIQNLII